MKAQRALICAAALLGAAAFAPLAHAQTPAGELPAAVTEEEIAVTSDFRGFSVTVFGFNPDRRGRGDLVVAVRGPMQPTSVSRRRRVFGLWVNGPPVRFAEAPSFFSVISERPLHDIASPQAILQLQLDPAASARLAPGAAVDAGEADLGEYRRALVRLRTAQGLFSADPGGLDMLSQRRLFRAQVRIPANAPIGDYVADVYLFQNRRLVSSQRSRVAVSRVGFERTIHEFAHETPVFYALAALGLAFGMGGAAGMLFRRR